MTTLADPRPWMPSGPHIGPDEVELAMLEQVEDPRDHIGSVALAIHRVGAATCEAVARAPLPDEYRLIESLAQAREAFADPVVDAVSKSLGEPRYAGLLARDLFDAAELGSLTVYRTCVSKGVAPPLAVQRAGLVYGVSPQQASRYLAVASDPRANQVAIADAADRTVLGWAAAVAREETAETKIDKAMSQAQFDDAVEGRRIVRGPRGQFVDVMERPTLVTPSAQIRSAPGALARQRIRIGVGGQVAPPVAGAPVKAPVEVPTKEEKPAPARRRKLQRLKRRKRKPAEDVATVSGVRTGAQRAVSTRTMQRVTAFEGERVRPVRARAKARPSEWDESVRLGAVVRDDSGVNWREFKLGRTRLAWSMDAEDARALYNDAEENSEGVKWLRIGNLASKLQQAPEEWRSAEQVDLIDGIIREQQTDLNESMSDVVTVEELENARVDVENRAMVWDYVKTNKLREKHANNLGLTPLDVAYMKIAPDSNYTGDWYIVSPPPRPLNAPSDYEEPSREAAEFVINDDSRMVEGMIEGTGKHTTHRLNPNQTYKVLKPTKLWNDRAGAWHYRYQLVPVEEGDVIKTMTAPQRRAMVAVQPRDELGMWTDTNRPRIRIVDRPRAALAETTPRLGLTRPPAPQRRKLQRLKRRKTAKPEGALVPAERTQIVRAHKLTPQQRSLATRAMVKAKAAQDDLGDKGLALHDAPVYRVFRPKEWSQLLADTGLPPLKPGERFTLSREELERRQWPSVVELHGNARTKYIESDDDSLKTGDQADEALRNSVSVLTEDKAGEVKIKSLSRHKFDPDDGAHWNELHRAVRMEMERDSRIHQARIVLGRASDGQMMAEVWRNSLPVDPHVLIMTGDQRLDPDKPMKLTFVKEWRQSSIHTPAGKSATYVPGVGLIDQNARLMVYTLQVADVKVYREEQDT